MFLSFLNVVRGLPANTVFSITADWLFDEHVTTQKDPNLAKSFGRRFAKVFADESCSNLGKGTDNHLQYRKN